MFGLLVAVYLFSALILVIHVMSRRRGAPPPATFPTGEALVPQSSEPGR